MTISISDDPGINGVLDDAVDRCGWNVAALFIFDCIRHGLEKGLLIPREQIIVCGKNCAVKYSNFEDIISLYSGQIEQSDRVIIYFSGHGGGAPFSLRFTDICKDFSEVCAEIDRLPACAKILIIDACHSGNGEVPELLTENPSHNLFDYARSGYAVFASSNAGSTSTCHPEKAVSLYTYCFSNALCHSKIHNGKVSLIDVAKQAALEADYISKTHGITLQHPVFKCHIPSDVLFQITEERVINNIHLRLLNCVYRRYADILYDQTFLDREESNRKVCMRGAVSKYREDLRRLVHVEECLKETGIITY